MFGSSTIQNIMKEFYAEIGETSKKDSIPCHAEDSKALPLKIAPVKNTGNGSWNLLNRDDPKKLIIKSESTKLNKNETTGAFRLNGRKAPQPYKSPFERSDSSRKNSYRDFIRNTRGPLITRSQTKKTCHKMRQRASIITRKESNSFNLESLKKSVESLLNNPALCGDTSSLFILQDVKMMRNIHLEPPAHLSEPNELKIFLLNSFNYLHENPTGFLMLLGKEKGIKEAFQTIISSEFSFDTTISAGKLDFQGSLLTLLFILSHPSIETSAYYTQTNFLLSMAKASLQSLFSSFLASMKKAIEIKSLYPLHLLNTNRDGCFIPVSFAQAFYPMIKFIWLLFRRFESCSRDKQQGENISGLEVLLQQWKCAMEAKTLIYTKESKIALDIVFAEFQKVKMLISETFDVTQKLKMIRERERKAKLIGIDDLWKGTPVEPPQGLFDNDHADFRNIKIIPTMEEIFFEGNACLPGNFPFSTFAHWIEPGPERLLDTQFRLLMMDMFNSISLGVRTFIEFMKEGKSIRCGRFRRNLEHQQVNLMVYTSVKLNGYCFDKFYGLCNQVSFDLPRLDSNNRARFWENCLQKDSLVCFIYNDSSFKVHFAVIAKRDEAPILEEDFEGSNSLVHFSDLNFDRLSLNLRKIYMLEFKGLLFESYRPILSSLQKMKAVDIPFASILCPPTPPINQCLPVEVPNYCSAEKRKYIFSFLQKRGTTLPLCPGNNNNQTSLKDFYPELESKDKYASYLSENSSLDKSQAYSLLGALTSNVCCIQGPPGSGKTYIGIQIVKALLKLPSNSIRILVMSLTNHALDQFLCHLAKEKVTKMLRISSKPNPELKQYDWYSNIRRSLCSKSMQDVFTRITEIQKNISYYMELLQTPLSKEMVWTHLLNCHPDIPAQIEIADLNRVSKRSYLEFWLKNKDLSFLQKKRKHMEEDLPHMHKRRKQSNLTKVDGESFVETAKMNDLIKEINSNTIFKNYEKEKVNNEVSQPENEAKNLDTVDDSSLHALPLTYELNEDILGWNKFKLKSRRHSKPIKTFLESLEIDEEDEDKEPLLDQMNLTLTTPFWTMDLKERKLQYQTWERELLSDIEKKMNDLKVDLKEEISKYRELESLDMSERIKHAQVLGITTTRASKYIDVLKAWRPTILLCEEAGEILEAHVIASLCDSMKQLILIGDHKQLRPRITEYDLSVESRKGKQYRLDVSLFERLMSPMCHLPLYTLQAQRRMKPIISQFIRKTVYSELQDGSNVLNQNSILGMQKDVFFMTHDYPQASIEEEFGGLGHSNVFEAEMIVETIIYFLKQGYAPNQLVVLTPYLSQLRLLRKRILDLDLNAYCHSKWRIGLTSSSDIQRYPKQELRSETVDNFQGEEADIILISLVRSTFASGSEKGIGFLKTENRITVMLSRAKLGMYLFGNAPLLTKNSNMWKSIVNMMQEQSLIDTKLPIVCPNHPDEVRYVENVKDFGRLSPYGGCLRKCNTRLKCGHACRLICHTKDSDHQAHKCRNPCDFHFPQCNHPCPKLCYESCGRCEAIIPSIELPKCKHSLKSVKCHVTLELDKIQCKEMVVHKRDCGHTFESECFKDKDDSVLCSELVQCTMNCGHKVVIECSKNCELMKKQHVCHVIVEPVKLPNCEHILQKPNCYEMSDLKKVNCKELVSRTRFCGHSVILECYKDVNKSECSHRCGKVLKCGHHCRSPCKSCISGPGKNYSHPPCPDHNQKQLSCFHECTQNENNSICSKPCLKTQCVHEKCQKLCGDVCQICLKNCTWQCVHQERCPWPCAYPCLRLPCDKQCKKYLSCGHQCPGVCGEECPSSKYCLLCPAKTNYLDKVQLALLRCYAKGIKENPLIFLRCGHFFPIQELDAKFGLEQFYEKGEQGWLSPKFPPPSKAKHLACPTCSYPVHVKYANRYSRIIKMALLYDANTAELAMTLKYFSMTASIILDWETFPTQEILNQIDELKQKFEGVSKKYFNSAPYKIALRLLGSSLSKSCLRTHPCCYLYYSPQHASFSAHYYVLKARMKILNPEKWVINITTYSEFALLQETFEDVQADFKAASEYYELSNATLYLVYLDLERTYYSIYYFIKLLQFIALGDFHELQLHIQANEIQQHILKLYNYTKVIPQIQSHVQQHRTLLMKISLHSYLETIQSIARLLQEKLEIINNDDSIDAKKAHTSSTLSFLKKFSDVHKFTIPFSNTAKYWNNCINGHFYPAPWKLYAKKTREKCPECGESPLEN